MTKKIFQEHIDALKALRAVYRHGLDIPLSESLTPARINLMRVISEEVTANWGKIKFDYEEYDYKRICAGRASYKGVPFAEVKVSGTDGTIIFTYVNDGILDKITKEVKKRSKFFIYAK